MEEKILLILVGMNQSLDEIHQKLKEIDGRLDGMDVRLDGMDIRLDGIDTRLDKVDKEILDLRQDMESFKEEMLDRQLVFEEEYGKKIDTIFDYVQFQKKINLQQFDKIDDLEKRVSVLERNTV